MYVTCFVIECNGHLTFRSWPQYFQKKKILTQVKRPSCWSYLTVLLVPHDVPHVDHLGMSFDLEHPHDVPHVDHLGMSFDLEHPPTCIR
jgi:hypothetical protein